MIPISKMAAAVQPSATLAAGAKARQLKTEGKIVHDFSLGEPDFNTPRHICEAAYKAMLDGHTHYTAAAGIVELRGVIARWYKRTYGYEFSPEQVIVSNGAKHSLHNALAATVGPGDEVIIPTPYWVSYSDLVQMTGASYVLVPTTDESGFKITPAQLKAAITPRSKLVMINSPSNPTGCVYSRAELEALADVILEAKIGVISDEIYEQLVYGNAKATCFATLRPKLADSVITISGVSKSYAMTGWRLGWLVCPPALAAVATSLQEPTTSCASTPSQKAGEAALAGDQNVLTDFREIFRRRRDLVVDAFANSSYLPIVPAGAFYALIDVSAAGANSFQTAKSALLEAGVAVVPGSTFGPASDGYVRIAFTIADKDLIEGIRRLRGFLDERSNQKTRRIAGE